MTFKNVFQNYFLPNQLTETVNSTKKEREILSIKRGDVFFTRTSETAEELGMSSVALKDYPEATFNGFTKRLRPKNNTNIIPEFIGYYFRWNFFRANIISMSSETTRASLNNSMLAQLPVFLPPLSEQCAIASVLSSLDDKIDLLHRENATLEKMAETLFRQWFIEEARDDWKEKKLGDIITISRGASPRPIVKYVKNGTVPWIKIADATSSNSLFIEKTKEFIIEEGISKSVEVFPGDLILSNSATCGLPCIVDIYGCIHDGWLLFRDFHILPKIYILFLLKYIAIDLNQIADGSVQDNLNTNILKEYKTKIPPKYKISTFNSIADNIINKMQMNIKQIYTLEKLRDTLLPKLMSGEVRVQYAEDAE